MVEVEGKHGKTSSAQKSTYRQQRFVFPVHTRRSSPSRCLPAIRTRATLADAEVRLAFWQWQVEPYSPPPPRPYLAASSLINPPPKNYHPDTHPIGRFSPISGDSRWQSRGEFGGEIKKHNPPKSSRLCSSKLAGVTDGGVENEKRLWLPKNQSAFPFPKENHFIAPFPFRRRVKGH